MTTAMVNSKGQVTIPARIRKKLCVKPGDRVRFIDGDHGEIILRKSGSLMDMRGCVERTSKPVTVEEMNETIARGWAGQLTFED